MPLFKSVGSAQGKYNPGGSRKKKYSRVVSSGKGKYGKSNLKKNSVYSKKSKINLKGKIKLKYNDVYNLFLDNQLHIYRYPFSTKTKHPKIPDGIVDNSIGLSFNISGVLRPVTTKKNFLIIFPGLTGCLFGGYVDENVVITHRGYFIQHCFPLSNVVSGGVNRNLVQGDTDGDLIADEYDMDVDDDGQFNADDDDDDGDNIPDAVDPTPAGEPVADPPPRAVDTNLGVLDYRQTGYSKYRYVSCGLRCGAANLAYSGSGKWEAIRVPCTKNMFSIDLTIPKNEAQHHLFNYPSFGEVVSKLLKTDWVHEPTFQTGSMKELGNYEFRLKCEDHSHDFVEIPRILEYHRNQMSANGFDITDGIDNSHLLEYTYDKTYDCVLIKYSSDKSNEELGYHVVANMEMIPNETGQMFSFSTACVKGKTKLMQVEKSIEKYTRLPGVLNAKKVYTKGHYNR